MSGPLVVLINGRPTGMLTAGAYAEPGAKVTFCSGGVPMWSGTLAEPEKTP